jgi:hypothetical protein
MTMSHSATPRRETTVSRLVPRLAGIAGGTVALLLAAAPAFAAPNPKPGLPNGVDAKLNTLLGMGMSIVIVACVAGVLICAAKLAIAIRHGEGAAAAGQLAAVGFACVLVGSAAGIVNYLV